MVVCDCCPEDEGNEAQAAVKTCLRCEISLCEQHLRPHLQRPAYSTHLLVEPLMMYPAAGALPIRTYSGITAWMIGSMSAQTAFWKDGMLNTKSKG